MTRPINMRKMSNGNFGRSLHTTAATWRFLLNYDFYCVRLITKFLHFSKKKSEKNICRNEKNLPFLISHCKFVANLTEIGSLVLAEKYQIENKNLLEWTQNGLTQRTGDFTICFDYSKIEEVLVKTN